MTGTPAGHDEFAHGVASFDPTATSVLLWTRTRHPGVVTWWVATDPDGHDVLVTGTAASEARTDRTVTVDVTGLEPATTYFYGFSRGEAASMTGRTRTLPADDVDSVRIGVTCCADFSVAPLGVYRALAEREVDLVLHLGDYIYEAQSSRSGRRAEHRETCTTVDEYRDRYAQLRADPDVRYLHARHPMVTIWDDHDLADNAWRTGAKAHDPDEHGDWRSRVAAAARARHEWLPSRLVEPDNPLRTWRAVSIGDLVDLVLLDTRFEGRDRHAGDEGTAPRDDPDRSLLGADQRSFVEERLADTRRPWTIVASGVVVNEISLPLPVYGRLPNRLLPNGYALLDGQVVHDDQWDGYVAERDHLVDLVEKRSGDGARTLLVSGDVHSCWAFEGPSGRDGEPVAVEAVCPAASSAAMGRANLPAMNRVLDHAVRRMPQVQWANVTERGYLLLEVDRDRARFEWWVVDPYADDPGATAACAAVRVLRHETWPCRFDVVDEREAADRPGPMRPDIPVVPDRPTDLRRLRAKRFARLAGKTAIAAATAGTAALATLRARRA